MVVVPFQLGTLFFLGECAKVCLASRILLNHLGSFRVRLVLFMLPKYFRTYYVEIWKCDSSCADEVCSAQPCSAGVRQVFLEGLQSAFRDSLMDAENVWPSS